MKGSAVRVRASASSDLQGFRSVPLPGEGMSESGDLKGVQGCRLRLAQTSKYVLLRWLHRLGRESMRHRTDGVDVCAEGAAEEARDARREGSNARAVVQVWVSLHAGAALGARHLGGGPGRPAVSDGGHHAV